MKYKAIKIIWVFIIVIIVITAIMYTRYQDNRDIISGIEPNLKMERKPDWQLVWSDEFDGDTLNPDKWSCQLGNAYNGWGNYEAQYYTKDNVSVEDGLLIITAKNENKEGYSYTSGRIRTVTDDGKILCATKYGRIEARISMPLGSGLWPAFWMMPADNSYGLWPLSGEIDIVEAKGRIPNVIDGTIHYGEVRPNNKQTNGEYVFEDSDISEFHVYAIEWNTDEIKWLVDDKVYLRASNWYTLGTEGTLEEYPAPFDKPFYILLNLAVGGTYDDGRLPETENLPAKMKVDYVRVYENKNGYRNVSDKRKLSYMDVEAYETVQRDNYISDAEFDTVNLIPHSATPFYKNNNWYFLGKSYFGGEGRGEIIQIEDKKYFFCHIDKPGEKRYALQLQYQVPLVKGYTYIVEFEAKADKDRQISFQPIGYINDEMVSYNNTLYFDVKDEFKKYYCTFTMKEDTNLRAILEFNLGLENSDVMIGNITMKCLD